MYRPDSADEGNLAALCLQCHDDTQIRGGFGRKLNAAQVIQYRDDWVKRIAEIRAARGRHIRLRLPSEDPRAPYKVIQGEEDRGTYNTRAEARRRQQQLQIEQSGDMADPSEGAGFRIGTATLRCSRHIPP
jgi:hypothetical protein